MFYMIKLVCFIGDGKGHIYLFWKWQECISNLLLWCTLFQAHCFIMGLWYISKIEIRTNAIKRLLWNPVYSHSQQHIIAVPVIVIYNLNYCNAWYSCNVMFAQNITNHCTATLLSHLIPTAVSHVLHLWHNKLPEKTGTFASWDHSILTLPGCTTFDQKTDLSGHCGSQWLEL